MIGTLIINQLFECQRYANVALHVHRIYQPIQCNLVLLYNNRQHLAERDRPTRYDTEVVASTKTDIKKPIPVLRIVTDLFKDKLQHVKCLP